MRFYINSLDDNKLGSSWSNKIIGLFDNNEWQGEGNFCGWYGCEYFLNTNLIAYFIQEDRGGKPYDPKSKYNEFHVVNRYYGAASIGSRRWTIEIEAATKEEAIEKFKNQSW